MCQTVQINASVSLVKKYNAGICPLLDFIPKCLSAFNHKTYGYKSTILFFCIFEGLMSRLQSVQNASTHLVTGTRCCDYITPVLHLLHWLLVRKRIDFKVATLVHQSLSGNSASYLADDCCLVANARERRLPVRSTESRTWVVTRTHSTFGDRAFAAASPGLWSSLPPHPNQKHI